MIILLLHIYARDTPRNTITLLYVIIIFYVYDVRVQSMYERVDPCHLITLTMRIIRVRYMF